MNPEPLPFGTPLEGANAGAWAVAMLDYKKYPVNNANVYSLAGWFLREGGGGANNPMNTTLHTSGSVNVEGINSDHVQEYQTVEDGIAATWETLAYYPNIEASFKAGEGLEHPNNETAIELGRWSGGGYTYIEPVVVPYVGATPVTPPKPPKPDMYYNRYDNTLRFVDPEHHQSSEYILVREYDEYRGYEALHALRLKIIRQQLHVLATRLGTLLEVAPNTKDTNWRAWRLENLKKRVNNEKLL